MKRVKSYYVVDNKGALVSVSLKEYKAYAKEKLNEQSVCVGQSFVWEQGGHDEEPQGCSDCEEAAVL
ncbi:hypothetical protein [Stenotrophomonas phage StenR_269]|nr:hypothetical protein [Stenotrophomonas phage StenR_269]